MRLAYEDKRDLSCISHVKEPVMKGHVFSDIEVSLEDRFHCVIIRNVNMLVSNL